MVEATLKHDPFSRNLFWFVNKRPDPCQGYDRRCLFYGVEGEFAS